MLGVIESTRRLADEALAGNHESFGLLYDALVEPVRAFLFGLRLNLAATEMQDAVQETFVRLFCQLDRTKTARSMTPYVLGIARHVALDLQRKKARSEKAAGSDIERMADSTDVAERVARAEQDVLVARTLDALKPDQRALLTLRHVNGLTMEELATAVGCSVPTARTRLRSAARALAGELRQSGVIPRETP